MGSHSYLVNLNTNIGDLQELASMFHHDHYTKAQAAERITNYDNHTAHDKANILANTSLDQATKDRLYKNLDF